MKNLFLILSAGLFAVAAYAQDDQKDLIIYGCHPLGATLDNNVEGAIVKVQDGKTVLAFYLTSENFGAVDEFIEQPVITEKNEIYLAESENASLEIDLKDSSQIMEGEHPANLKLKKSSQTTEMFCLKGEF